ncbi:MAG TPA: carboxypeptidase-like regulatory domain-containing protein, partial [Nitrospirota bacterium]
MTTKRVVGTILIAAAASFLFACGGEKLDLRVKARMGGQPVAQARVTVDKEELGLTGADGVLSKTIKKKPGAEVEVVVSKELTGYRIKPWKNAFLMKLPKSGAVDTYSFDADLVSTRYVTLVVTEKGAPVPDAVVKAAGKEAGKTDPQGVFEYEYTDLPRAGLDLAVTKSGYSAWRRTAAVEPGQKIEVALSKRVTVVISALMEEYGQTSGIAGVAVSVNNKDAGKTDAKGSLTYTYDGEPGTKASLSLSAPGYIPETWKTSIVLEGEVNVQRYFYPTAPRQIRTGIYRFVGNTPNADLKDAVSQAETAVGAQLFKYACFREVPSKTLQADMKRAKLSIERATTKGWRETPLKKTVDMIILGSIAKDE